MKKFKRMGMLTGAVLLTLSLAACAKGKEAKESDGTQTLLMYQIGDKPENYDELMEIANKRVKEKINATIDLQYIGWGDWDNKMSTIIASGENYDVSFVKNYVANAQKGAYADLTELAPKHAKEAYEQLDEAYIQGNMIDGKLYAFPVNANIYGQKVLSFNKQYLDKHNLSIEGIETYEDAEAVLKEFHEKEPQIAAFAIGQDFQPSGNFDYPLGDSLPFAIKLDDEKTKIINPYADSDRINDLNTLHRWYNAGYIPTDASTNTQGYPLEGNTWFMREETQGPMDYGDTILTNAAGQEIVSKAITIPLKSTMQAQVANFAVSNVSKNKEKAVELIGLINSDPELLNGLVWGVEGKAWEKTGDNRIKLLDGYQPNTHMSAWNTGNNHILYIQDTISDELILERDEKISQAEKSPILGFNFKTDNVKTELTNIANVFNRYKSGLCTGTVNPEEVLPDLLADLETAGWDKVQEDMQVQLDQFLAESN